MGKLVHYNGRTDSDYGCTSPTELVIGQEYEVVSEIYRGSQTDYTLKGITGQFNSSWFDQLPSTKTYMALSKNVPIIGQRLHCSRIGFLDGDPCLVSWSTSAVKEFCHIGNNIYRVITCNSIYYVKVD